MKSGSGWVPCTCRYVLTDTGYIQTFDRECRVHRPINVVYRDHEDFKEQQ